MSILFQRLKLGAQLLSEKRLDAAQDVYLSIHHLVPEMPDAWYGLYKVSLARGEKLQAIRHFRRALFSLSLTILDKPQDKRLFERWLAEYESLSDVSLFESVTAHPLHGKLTQQVERLVSRGKYARASEVLVAHRKKFGWSEILVYWWMLTLDGMGEAEEACEAAYSVCHYFSEDYVKIKRAAGVFVKSLLYYPAIKAYLRAHRLRPGEHAPLNNLGAIAMEMEQIYAAKKFLHQALAVRPESMHSRSMLVQCLEEDGLLDQALTVIEEGRKYAEDVELKFIMFFYRAFYVDMLRRVLKRQDLLGSQPLTYFIAAVLFGQRSVAERALQRFMSSCRDSSSRFREDGRFVSRLKALEGSVTLIPVGRAGSLFFHSLMDGCSDVVTIPGVYLKGFFGNGVWQRLYPGHDHDQWRKALVERFMRMYEAMFDCRSNAPVPGDPMSGKTGIGENCGLTRMGTQQDQVLAVNADRFAGLMRRYLSAFERISQAAFFKLVHLVWAEVTGDVRTKKLVFYHIHNPNVSEYGRFVKLFPNNRNLFIVRDVIKAAESWMYTQMPDEEGLRRIEQMNDAQRRGLLAYMLSKAYGRLIAMLVHVRHLACVSEQSWAVRLEDVKNAPEPMMRKVADFMGVSFDPAMLESAFLGLKYYGPKSKLHGNIQGFSRENIDRGCVLLSSEDAATLEVIFYPFMKAFEYRNEAQRPNCSARKRAKVYNVEVFDFERRFAEVVGVNEQVLMSLDVLGKRRRLFDYLLDHAELIEQDLERITVLR